MAPTRPAKRTAARGCREPRQDGAARALQCRERAWAYPDQACHFDGVILAVDLPYGSKGLCPPRRGQSQFVDRVAYITKRPLVLKKLLIAFYYAVLLVATPYLGLPIAYLFPGGSASTLGFIAMLWTLPLVLCLARYIVNEKNK